jgi:hypothetical protein
MAIEIRSERVPTMLTKKLVKKLDRMAKKLGVTRSTCLKLLVERA